MFIITLTNIEPIEIVELHLADHRCYLEKNYKDGYFIASGRQEPRIGGVILCKAGSREFVWDLIQSDPFCIHQIAKYDIIEFVPTMFAEGFERFV